MGLELVRKERKERKGRLTVAADKNYDTKDFVRELRTMVVTPHVARKDKYSAIDGRTTSWEGYAQSQKKRKLVEEAFGWMKTVGLLDKLRHRGRAKARWVFQFTAAAYNLVRMRSLLAECVTG
jgi:IS5 family transposase